MKLDEDDDPVLAHLMHLLEHDCHVPNVGTENRRIHRGALRRLLIRIDDTYAKLLDAGESISGLRLNGPNAYIEVLTVLAAYAHFWIRPAEEWVPPSHNSRRQFSSLVRHLFVKYEMPTFLESVWFAPAIEESAKWRRLFLHVARGENVRHFDLPVVYTKRMAHEFMRAPADLSISQAIRWGQVLGLGGDRPLARAILGTRLSYEFEHEEFWLSVIRWFIQNPIVPAEVGGIVDYLHNQRFVIERVRRQPGDEAARPPQPNLSMKGRSPEVLLRQVEQWHAQLAELQHCPMRSWPPCGIPGIEWKDPHVPENKPRYWTIHELLTTRDLVREGQKMHHCVASYDDECFTGDSAIFTMEIDSFAGLEKAVTIEVSLDDREIIQVRGKCNRVMTDEEHVVLTHWAKRTGLKISPYVRSEEYV
ncbi:PcfJ domain-containing protein [Calycomorphotria hydatis]|uniref:PcfJ domain-containing protein n=1 Tax=Calycomorphotria hydatis TaxID=2528027 RepID=UPI0018D26ADF|nr:PcfJ domain-containing protein [Calycomorphotria hydatis]